MRSRRAVFRQPFCRVLRGFVARLEPLAVKQLDLRSSYSGKSLRLVCLRTQIVYQAKPAKIGYQRTMFFVAA